MEDPTEKTLNLKNFESLKRVTRRTPKLNWIKSL